jgi:hypothetical protein
MKRRKQKAVSQNSARAMSRGGAVAVLVVVVYGEGMLSFARDPVVFHSLGAFSATFMFALSTLAWVDWDGSGAIPFYSAIAHPPQDERRFGFKKS